MEVQVKPSTCSKWVNKGNVWGSGNVWGRLTLQGWFYTKDEGPSALAALWASRLFVPHGSEILWQGTSYVTAWLCHWPLVTTTSLSVFVADSPQVSHFPLLCLCFCIPRLSILSNCTAGLCGKWPFPLWRWLCDGSPVLVGNSKPYVIHEVKEMQTSERGTGPWEAFPMSWSWWLKSVSSIDRPHLCM